MLQRELLLLPNAPQHFPGQGRMLQKMSIHREVMKEGYPQTDAMYGQARAQFMPIHFKFLISNINTRILHLKLYNF